MDNTNIPAVKIAAILTSGRFEWLYNKFVVENQSDERDPLFVAAVENLFKDVYTTKN